MDSPFHLTGICISPSIFGRPKTQAYEILPGFICRVEILRYIINTRGIVRIFICRVEILRYIINTRDIVRILLRWTEQDSMGIDLLPALTPVYRGNGGVQNLNLVCCRGNAAM